MCFDAICSFGARPRLLMLLVLCAGLSGCASTATKNAVVNVTSSTSVYGLVTSVDTSGYDGFRKECKTIWKDVIESQSFCARLEEYDIARLHIMHVGRTIQAGALVPKAEKVRKGNIVEVNPTHGAGSFKRIAAREESEACRWVGGPKPENLNGRTGIALSFLAGMLIVPAVVVLTNDDLLSGGVECDGWTYKTLWEKAKADANSR